MNLIAIDIGNSTIKLALYVDGQELGLQRIDGNDPQSDDLLSRTLQDFWRQVPKVASAKEPVRDGVIVASSVKDIWTQRMEQICRQRLNESMLLIGRDIPLPMEVNVEDPSKVGTDRIVTAAAAYAVVEDSVVIADFGTAVTIDLVDEKGVFMGGIIAPGFALGAKALHEHTAKLPLVQVDRPLGSYGVNTHQAINAGLYYAAVGLLETMMRKYAEEVGKWPHLVATGAAAELLKGECEFVDSWVPDLALRGIVIAYKKYLYEKNEIEELDSKNGG